MEFNSDEKLMLFLIWCIGERGLSIDFHDGFGDEEIWLWINKHGAFREFLSEACEAKEEFEFWVSDFDLEDIKESAIQNTPLLCNHRDYYFKNRIKVTIGD